VEENETYPIDILPYCPTGDLEKQARKFSYQELKTRVIPALTTALNVMHQNGIIHRDIKPKNIYEFDGEIVVSDFGIAVITDDDDDNIVHTQFARGSFDYTAPEVLERYAKKASDYFSLGCTIATLYNGEHPYAKVLSNPETVGSFRELMKKQGIKMSYNKDEEDLDFLINALVRWRDDERPGYDGVMLWLRDSNAFYNEYVANYGSHKTRGEWEKGYRFDENSDVEYWNETDLAAAMLADWKKACNQLYRGYFHNHFTWNQALQNKLRDIVDDRDTRTNFDLGLARFFHYLLKDGSFYWCGHKFDALSDISDYIWNVQKDYKKRTTPDTQVFDKITQMLKSKYLSWKYAKILQLPNLSESDKPDVQNNLNIVRKIEDIADNYPVLAYYNIMFQWIDKDKFDVTIAETISATPFDLDYVDRLLEEFSADRLFHEMTKSPQVFYDRCKMFLQNDYECSQLSSVGFSDQVLAFKRLPGNDFRGSINNIYILFESICENKRTVRNHYLNYSPDAYLYWLRNNMRLYSFHSTEAKEQKEKIEKISFAENVPFGELGDGINKLKTLSVHFKSLFQGDFLLACLGLTSGKDRHGEITATHADAFFIERFLGEDVPAGFRKKLRLPLGSYVENEPKG
jgi:serine/threonine protein kinase